ncbi:hydrolase [Glycocaulis albus]|uniref:Hydrolase n=1 Tax=Glycocaulis albus TaxID=1382801 RepID=A0ABQ1XVG1_9PROT|nr:endonuclease/exonuclease/phosphatase family protein [Glycocaulis albus]GGH04546.1 hydrolase [Glycocaulis albus]
MKWVMAGLSALSLAACDAGSPTPSAGPAEGVRIASWNIEHLAAENGHGCAPRDDEGYARVAAVIDDIDADIWLLQEVENEVALARVFNPDEWTFHIEARPAGAADDYPLCRGRYDGTRLTMQATAIAVRNGIEHQPLPALQALDVEGNDRLRWGVAITLPGETPTDIMSVHLKSGCFSGSDASACPVLLDQVPVLESWIDERSAAGRAVIVGGDFNRRLETDGDAVWLDLNDGNPAPLAIAGAGIGPRCNPRYREFIDFIVFNEAAGRSKVEGSFFETTFSGPRDTHPSDHCPIGAVFRY